jgi:hypothetical protein
MLRPQCYVYTDNYNLMYAYICNICWHVKLQCKVVSVYTYNYNVISITSVFCIYNFVYILYQVEEEGDTYDKRATWEDNGKVFEYFVLSVYLIVHNVEWTVFSSYIYYGNKSTNTISGL